MAAEAHFGIVGDRSEIVKEARSENEEGHSGTEAARSEIEAGDHFEIGEEGHFGRLEDHFERFAESPDSQEAEIAVVEGSLGCSGTEAVQAD